MEGVLGSGCLLGGPAHGQRRPEAPMCIGEPGLRFPLLRKDDMDVVLRLVATNHHEAVSHDEEPLLHFYVILKYMGQGGFEPPTVRI